MNKARLVFAILVILIGIAGIFLPIVPGIILILFGIYLICPEWIKGKLQQWGIRWKNLK